MLRVIQYYLSALWQLYPILSFAYLYLSFISLSLFHSFSDVLPSSSLHPQGAAEEDPLLHFPSDGAAAFSVCVWDVPSPVYEDDLSSANVYPHTHQVSTEMPSAPVCCVVCDLLCMCNKWCLLKVILQNDEWCFTLCSWQREKKSFESSQKCTLFSHVLFIYFEKLHILIIIFRQNDKILS